MGRTDAAGKYSISSVPKNSYLALASHRATRVASSEEEERYIWLAKAPDQGGNVNFTNRNLIKSKELVEWEAKARDDIATNKPNLTNDFKRHLEWIDTLHQLLGNLEAVAQEKESLLTRKKHLLKELYEAEDNLYKKKSLVSDLTQKVTTNDARVAGLNAQIKSTKLKMID